MNSSPKETLRAEALRHRARMHAEDPDKAVAHFFKAIDPPPGAIIAGYWPKDGEFDVKPLLDELLKKGYACALPVMRKGTRELGFARWGRDTKLREASFGVMEPPVNDQTEWVEPDIVIVPLLAFDRRGHRLGYGQGYYDATLKALRERKKILAVGMGYAQQAVLFNLPVEEHDQKLDWVVTALDAVGFEPGGF